MMSDSIRTCGPGQDRDQVRVRMRMAQHSLSVEETQLAVRPIETHQLFDMLDSLEGGIKCQVGNRLVGMKNREVHLSSQRLGAADVWLRRGLVP